MPPSILEDMTMGKTKRKAMGDYPKPVALYVNDRGVCDEFRAKIRSLDVKNGVGITRVLAWFLRQPEDEQRAILAGLK